MDRQPTMLARLTDSVRTLRDRPLSPELAEKARICLLDYLAAACAGTTNSTARAAKNAAACFGPGNCTLIGAETTGSPAAAALHNGLLGHAEELDDSHRYASGMHQGTTTIPAALALAEELDAPGALLLKAVVCGYEAAGRVIRCMDKTHRDRGFHATGTVGPFGAAAASAVMLGLSRDELYAALGLAASTAAGTFAFLENGATVKHFHAGRPPLDGLMAALLAQGGMTAPDRVFEAREGFFNAYAGDVASQYLDAALPTPEILNVYHKIHSACGHSFPAIDAALFLRQTLREEGLESECLASVTLGAYKAAAVLVNRKPATIQEARFSLPFVFALALVKGSVTRADLAEEVLDDQRILTLCNKITVTEDPEVNAAFPDERGGRMRAVTADGRVFTHTVRAPLGMPDNPVSLDTLRNKFRTEASALLPAKTVEAVIDLVQAVGEAPSVRPLMARLREIRTR